MSHSTRLDLVEEYFDSEEVRLYVPVVHTQVENCTYQKDTGSYVIHIRYRRKWIGEDACHPRYLHIGY